MDTWTRIRPLMPRHAGDLSSTADVEPIHLHDVQAVPDAPARQAGAQGHLAELPAGRQDRRARAQRRRQVDPAADHGRARTPSTAARRSSRPARPSACSSRSRTSTRPRTCAATSRTGSRELRDLLDRFNELAANYSDETADEFARLQEQIDAADAWNLDDHARPGDGRAAAARPATPTSPRLSGGERRRVALCRLLLSAPDLLLLDEPTNHLDAESVAWLERHLEEYKGTVVAVTHDRYFLDNVAGWILELDRGHGIPFKGNYSSWLEQKQARLAQEERQETARQRTIARRARVGAREPEGPPHEVQGAPGPLRGAARRGAQRQARPGPDPHPAPGRASAAR